MHRRLNITLPEETLQLIDRVTAKGDRSNFIDTAVKHYVEKVGKENLCKQIKEGAIRRAERDLQVASEWFAVDEEAWQQERK